MKLNNERSRKEGDSSISIYEDESFEYHTECAFQLDTNLATSGNT